jgi:phosphoglycolate phosphatase
MTEMPAYTLACFGLIGTTVADDGSLERAYAEAIATQGIVTGTTAFARSMAQVHRARGKAVIDVLRELFPGNEARAQAAYLAFDKSLRGAVQRGRVEPVPGAAETMDALTTAGWRICLVSSLARRHVDAYLAALGWRDRFDLVIGADEVPRGCPYPDPFLQAMLKLGVDDVREALAVQSTDSGVVAGCRSGAGLVAGVLTGTHPAARLRRAGARHVLASIADLPAVLAAAAAAAEPGSAPRVTVPRPAPATPGLVEGARAEPGRREAARSEPTRSEPAQPFIRHAGPAVF